MFYAHRHAGDSFIESLFKPTTRLGNSNNRRISAMWMCFKSSNIKRAALAKLPWETPYLMYKDKFERQYYDVI
jgi:spore coat protein CotF